MSEVDFKSRRNDVTVYSSVATRREVIVTKKQNEIQSVSSVIGFFFVLNCLMFTWRKNNIY